MHKKEKIKQMLQLQQESGLSIIDFCHNYGISTATFYNRKRWLKLSEKQPILAPIQVEEQQSFKEEVHRGHSQVLEMKYPNGIELRISGVLDQDLLLTLLNPQSRH